MFNLEDDAPSRRLAYLAGLLLIVIPTLQAVTQLWPLQFGNIQWRFQAAGSLSSVLLLPFLGLVLIALIARSSESRGISRTIGILSIIMALVMGASLVLFVLDALQLKTIVTSRAMQGFQITFFRVGLVSGLFSLLFAFLGWVSLKGTGSGSVSKGKSSQRKIVEDDEAGSGLLIG